MEKHEETRYVKRTQKITQCLNYKLFKKLKGQLTVTESTKTYGIQNRTTVVKWLKKNSVTLIGKPNTIYYVKVARTKDHGA
jgi:hypothetical protein